MALEISEIGISMRVSDPDCEQPGAGGAAASAGTPEVEREDLVADCVRQVLDLLRDSEER